MSITEYFLLCFLLNSATASDRRSSWSSLIYVRLAVSGGLSVRKDPDGRVLQRGQDTLDDPVVRASRHMSITPSKTVPQR